MPAEHVPQVAFLQVMHIHHVAICSMRFSMFSRESQLTEEGLASTFSSESFLMRTSCIN